MFIPVKYDSLNARQQENYNFHKVAACLADYGYHCLKLNDDWQGADFIACHIDGEQFLKIQLKGRMCLDKKYIGKNIHIAYLENTFCYIYPHDEMMGYVLNLNKINNTQSWVENGCYTWKKSPQWVETILNQYKLSTIHPHIPCFSKKIDDAENV